MKLQKNLNILYKCYFVFENQSSYIFIFLQFNIFTLYLEAFLK